MKSLLAFAAGMRVGILATLGWSLAPHVDLATPVDMRRDVAGLAAAVRNAAGVLAAKLDPAHPESPREWALRRPVLRNLRMARSGVVLLHRILPEPPAHVAGSASSPPPPAAAAPPSLSTAAGVAPDARPEVPQDSQATAPGKMQTSSGILPAETAGRVYARALHAYEDKRHEEARQLFAAFLDDFPGHALTPNALYWTGETWYDQARYDKAAEAFARVLKDHPRHSKSPDALLKLAYSAMRQGRTEQAREYLDQLLTRYPGSDASRLGRQARGRLQGSGRPGTMVATHG
jgi:tol-pal system protein YbgF